VLSDIRSHVSDLQSDFQSRVPKRVATDSQLSNLHSDLKVYATGASGVQSDIYSLLSDVQSDFQSRVPKRVATESQLSDVWSDLQSDIANITVTISASDVSDIASAVVAGLPVASQISDIYSLLSDLSSDFQSRVPKRVATDSQLSNVQSDVRSLIAALSLSVSASDISDIASAVQALILDSANGVETGLTVREALKLMAAALAGKISGAATTTITIRNAVADSKDRIVATVDVNGNRTAITTDTTP
jgi:uncharacterized protein YeeX (DUF496 family)